MGSALIVYIGVMKKVIVLMVQMKRTALKLFYHAPSIHIIATTVTNVLTTVCSVTTKKIVQKAMMNQILVVSMNVHPIMVVVFTTVETCQLVIYARVNQAINWLWTIKLVWISMSVQFSGSAAKVV